MDVNVLQYFVTSKVHKALKEIGFDEGPLPTWCHAIDYLDRKFKIKIEQYISPATGKYKYGIRFYNPNLKANSWDKIFNPLSDFSRIERDERALLHAIIILDEIKIQ